MAIVADLSGNSTTVSSYETYSRTNAGSPNGSLTPAFVGEIVLDTTNHVLYKAQSAANSSWVQVSVLIP